MPLGVDSRDAFNQWLMGFESLPRLTENDFAEFWDRMQVATVNGFWGDQNLRRYCKNLMSALEEGHLSTEELRPAQAN